MLRQLRGVRLLALFLAFIFVVAACGDDGGDDGGDDASGDTASGDCATADSSIWVLLPDTESSDRWETQDKPLFEQAFADAGIDATVVNAEGDAQQQQSQAEQAIAEGAGVIVLTAWPRRLCAAQIASQQRSCEASAAAYSGAPGCGTCGPCS